MRYHSRMGSIAGGLTWLMDQVGYAICHQLSERTLTYGGRALPVCARDAGIFLGFAACFIALVVAYGREPRRYPSWPKLLTLALFLLPTALDAATSYAGLRESTNTIRLATGALAGTGLAALVYPLARSALAPAADIPEGQTAFASWWSVPLLLVIPAAISLILLAGLARRLLDMGAAGDALDNIHPVRSQPHSHRPGDRVGEGRGAGSRRWARWPAPRLRRPLWR